MEENKCIVRRLCGLLRHNESLFAFAKVQNWVGDLPDGCVDLHGNIQVGRWPTRSL